MKSALLLKNCLYSDMPEVNINFKEFDFYISKNGLQKSLTKKNSMYRFTGAVLRVSYAIIFICGRGEGKNVKQIFQGDDSSADALSLFLIVLISVHKQIQCSYQLLCGFLGY